MSERSAYPDANAEAGDDTAIRPDDGSPPGVPPWVKVFGIVALVLVVLFVIMLLSGGGGGHGPGRHTSANSARDGYVAVAAEQQQHDAVQRL